MPTSPQLTLSALQPALGPLGYTNLALVAVNLLCLFSFVWSQYRRKVKYYDRSIRILEEEQGEWFVNFVIERELAKLFKHYTRDGAIEAEDSDECDSDECDSDECDIDSDECDCDDDCDEDCDCGCHEDDCDSNCNSECECECHNETDNADSDIDNADSETDNADSETDNADSETDNDGSEIDNADSEIVDGIKPVEKGFKLVTAATYNMVSDQSVTSLGRSAVKKNLPGPAPTVLKAAIVQQTTRRAARRAARRATSRAARRAAQIVNLS